MTAVATNLVRTVIPRPRVRPTWRSAIPLAVFAVAFAGTSLYVHFAGVLLFTRPAAFYLSVLMAWFWWMHVAGGSGMRGLRWLTALVVRVALVGLFIMLLAEPRGVRNNDTLSLIYSLDVSDSIGEAASESAQKIMIDTAQARPEKDQAGLIVFGGNAAVELPPRGPEAPVAGGGQPQRRLQRQRDAPVEEADDLGHRLADRRRVQAQLGGDQGLRNSARHHPGISCPVQGDHMKGIDHSGHGAQQTEQRGDGAQDAQGRKEALQVGELREDRFLEHALQGLPLFVPGSQPRRKDVVDRPALFIFHHDCPALLPAAL